jgi:hypothetical protein
MRPIGQKVAPKPQRARQTAPSLEMGERVIRVKQGRARHAGRDTSTALAPPGAPGSGWRNQPIVLGLFAKHGRRSMMHKSFLIAFACIALSSTSFAQGGGGGGGGGAGGGAAASSGSSSGSSAGTGTSSSANGGPSAPSGLGTHGTTTGAQTNTSRINPNVQPPTPNGTAPNSGATARQSVPAPNTGIQSNITTGANQTNTNSPINSNAQPPTANGMSPTAAQAERNAGVGHAANGQPIGTPGTGTSNEDQK